MFWRMFLFYFFPTHFFRRLQTDIFETFPHDVALQLGDVFFNKFIYLRDIIYFVLAASLLLLRTVRLIC